MLEDEDDTHLCLKCRATITGLDNYVRHRKAGCPPPIDREPELRADDFFSSLELQSKKVPDDPYDDLDDDLEDEEDAGVGVPPRSHTGGKWRPSAASWNILTPPPSFTGGKWRPIIMPPEPPETPVVEPPPQPPPQPPPPPTEHEPHAGRSGWDDDGGPPPGHTSGKWMPGRRAVRKQGNTVQYWCGPCSRRLSSRSMYQRHLQSELHFKRTALGDNQLPGETETHTTRTSKRAPGKRLVRRTPAYVHSHLWCPSKRKRLQEEAEDLKKQTAKEVSVPTPTTRARRRLVEQCDACRARFPAHQWGKHLLSHFHWRRGVVSRQVHEALVLKHMDSVVRLAPFRCQPCRFYCNSGDVLLQHIRSQTHGALDRKLEGEYWCSLCRHSTTRSRDLENHLVSPHHLEMVSAAAGSLPVELRRRQLPSCSTCSMEFQYRIQLKVHGRRTGHCLDAAAPGVQCSQCHFKGRSKMSLQRHSLMKHGRSSYFCSTCSLEFTSAPEALAHRRSSEHRFVLFQRYGAKKRQCPHCIEVINGLQQFKEHILERHPEESHQCQLCGQKFALVQELRHHSREKECVVSDDKDAVLKHACPLCPYRSHSRAEFLFHSAMHVGKRVRFPCPECGLQFRRGALLGHLRTHTDERPHACPMCDRGFHNRSAMLTHVRQVHGNQWHTCPHCSFRSTSKKSTERHIRTHGPRDRAFLCAVCGRSFFLKTTLQQHMKLHAGKDVTCPTRDCVYRCRSLAELRAHQRTHSDERPYHCDSCSYASKTKSQLLRHNQIHLGEKPYKCEHCSFSSRLSTHLKRHLRVHTGAKPFKCPHCPYTCNILENLRKHVINTNRHPGKKLYECRLCSGYDTNLAAEFRVHLVQQHPEAFRSVAVAASYIAGLYNNEDESSVSTPQQWTAIRSNSKNSPDSLEAAMASMKDDAGDDGCWTEQVVEVQGDGLCIPEGAQVQQETIVLIQDSHAGVKKTQLQFLSVLQ